MFAYLRKGYEEKDDLLIVLNLTPVVRQDFRIGVPKNGVWEEILNSDQLDFYGSGIVVQAYNSNTVHWMGFDQSIVMTLPPLGGLILKRKA
ncbi:1,4-alpha-glucan branching enzyme GlgB [compost metagenome]